MRRLSEQAKAEMGLIPMALNNTNTTGQYFKVAKYGRILFTLLIAAMAATKTAILALYEATDADGTDAAAITSATCTVTANTLVHEATIALASVANTDVVEINGISFTKAAATDATAREFADAAGLVTCVNNATYGVEGVTASAADTTVTVKATEPGDYTISLDKTENAGTITLATVKAMCFVDLDACKLSAGFTHVAAKVTTTANTTVAVLAQRYSGRFTPVQKVGASATL